MISSQVTRKDNILPVNDNNLEQLEVKRSELINLMKSYPVLVQNIFKVLENPFLLSDGTIKEAWNSNVLGLQALITQCQLECKAHNTFDSLLSNLQKVNR
jgi:hypothetical protein